MHVYDAMSALCASHSLSAKDLGCARHAARWAICQTDHIIMFPFTWNGFDHPHLKSAEENVKSQIEGTITVRWQVHCAHQEASPFSLSPVTPRSRCLQPSLQGADKVPYRDWHSVHDLELPCHCKRAGIDDLTSSTLTGVVRHDLELPCHCERAGIAPAL